jgi:hypothetical protein
MRAGWLVSLIGHIGAVLMTTLMWEVRSTPTPEIMSVVPVEIVDVAVESNVRALAEDVPIEDMRARPEEQLREEAAAPAPNRRPNRDEEAFNRYLSRPSLVNTDDKVGPQRNDGETSDINRPGSGLGNEAEVALRDRMRALADAHIDRGRCWRGVDDLPYPERLVVVIGFELNRNGTLRGQPRLVEPRNATFDSYMQEAINRAMRAIRLCEPFNFQDDPVVGEQYELWRDMEYRFDSAQSQ